MCATLEPYRTKFAPEIVVRVYRDGRLIEQRFCNDEAKAAEIVESWGAVAGPEGEIVSVESYPPNDIVGVLRALADALERGEPVTMPHRFPPVRLQLVIEGTAAKKRSGELYLLWQELSHPGG